MARAFYSEYVNHCLRFYARHSNPEFSSEADKQNWQCCDTAIKTFSPSEQYVILDIYRGNTPIPEKVVQIANTTGNKTYTVWKLINDLERKVAKRRGLL